MIQSGKVGGDGADRAHNQGVIARFREDVRLYEEEMKKLYPWLAECFHRLGVKLGGHA